MSAELARDPRTARAQKSLHAAERAEQRVTLDRVVIGNPDRSAARDFFIGLLDATVESDDTEVRRPGGKVGVIDRGHEKSGQAGQPIAY